MNETDSKSCCKCDIIKELSEFCFKKDTKENRNQRRDCIELIFKEYKSVNKDEIKLYNKNYFKIIKKNCIRKKNEI